jgi:8-oxo-dGTP pyrophosphatase MutT (NUDIX family)
MRNMAAGRRKTRNEHSSGGAVIAVREGVPHVALIATRNRTRWGLPKGAVNEGETAEAAALREVLEETGLQAKIVKPLDTIEYYFRAGDTLIHKRVDFYLMDYVAGELQPQLSEVDDVEWVELTAALRRASFDSERKLLEMALQSMDSSSSLGSSSPLPSSPASSSSS